MNLHDISILYKREIRSAFRERAIVVNSIVLPIVLYPVMLWLIYSGAAFVQGQTEGMTVRILLKDVPAEHRVLRLSIEAEGRIEFVESNNPEEDIRRGALDAAVEFLPPSEIGTALPGNFSVRLLHDESKDRSRTARTRMEDQLTRYRDRHLRETAATLGVSDVQIDTPWIDMKNLASERQMGQFLLGLMLPLFLVIMVGMGATYPAIDSTAGERENSTWETVMTLATDRSNVVVSKFLYVATMAVTGGLLNLAAMTLSMRTVLAPLLRRDAEEFSFRLPLQALPVIAMGAILLALFVASGMMILASFARTFKEGQAMVGPWLMLVLIIPVQFLLVPDMRLTPRMALLPVANITLVFKEAIAGAYNWPLIALSLGVEAACVALALWLATVILKYEDFVIGSYNGSLFKFLRERLLKRT